MITTIGVSYILFNVVPAHGRRGLEELSEPAAAGEVPHPRRSDRTARDPDLGRFRRTHGSTVDVRAALSSRQGDAGDRAGPRGCAHDGCGGGQGHHHRVLYRLGTGRRQRADLRPLLQLHQLHHRVHCRPACLHRRGSRRHRQRAGGDGRRCDHRSGGSLLWPVHRRRVGRRHYLLDPGAGPGIPARGPVRPDGARANPEPEDRFPMPSNAMPLAARLTRPCRSSRSRGAIS